jgi:DNA-binding NarL/FixJ family response regulator
MSTVLERPTREPTAGTPATASKEQLRLLVVDDHPAVRRGVRGLLEEQLDFCVVATVASAEEALAIARRVSIDVAVVDYQLEARSGLWLSRKLKRLADPPRVVIYSAYSDVLLAAAAVAAQADALVSKGGLGSDLAEAIRAVSAGHLRLPSVPWQLAEVVRRRLNDREQAIYGMLLAGIPLSEVAVTLRTSEASINSDLWEMLYKLEPIDPARRQAQGT